MTSDSNIRTLAARTVRAFHPANHSDTALARIELLRRGPGVRAGDPAGETRWEVHVTVADEPAITSSAENTWSALLLARIELEEHGWHLAIAAARLDHTVLDPDRQRESTTVSELTTDGRGAQPGIFQDADPATIATVAEQAQHRTAWIERRYGPRSNSADQRT